MHEEFYSLIEKLKNILNFLYALGDAVAKL